MQSTVTAKISGVNSDLNFSLSIKPEHWKVTDIKTVIITSYLTYKMHINHLKYNVGFMFSELEKGQ